MSIAAQRTVTSAGPARRLAPFSSCPIGVDFGTERINMVQFFQSSGLKVRAACSQPYLSNREETLSDSASLKSLIAPLLLKHGFRGRRAVVAVPPSMVKLRFISYRCEGPESDVAAILRVGREQMGTALDNAVLDYIPIKSKDDAQRDRSALLAVAPRAEIDVLLDVLSGARLKVSALEIGPVAIKRLLANVHAGRTGEKILVVNFGWKKTYVTVLWNGELLLDKDVDFGQAALLDMLASALEVTPAEADAIMARTVLDPASNQGSIATADNGDFGAAAYEMLKPAFASLAEQIRKVLVYTAAETRGGAIEQVYLLGSVARWQGTDAILSRLVGVPSATLNPFFGFEPGQPGKNRAQLEPIAGIAVATGLALSGLTHND